MPFRSQAQRGYLHARHPEVAARFEAETPRGERLPEHARGDARRRLRDRVLRRDDERRRRR